MDLIFTCHLLTNVMEYSPYYLRTWFRHSCVSPLSGRRRVSPLTRNEISIHPEPKQKTGSILTVCNVLFNIYFSNSTTVSKTPFVLPTLSEISRPQIVNIIFEVFVIFHRVQPKGLCLRFCQNTSSKYLLTRILYAAYFHFFRSDPIRLRSPNTV